MKIVLLTILKNLFTYLGIWFVYFAFSDHVSAEMDFSKALNRLGENSIGREDVGDYGSDDIGAAFQKFSVDTKELSKLMKNLVSSGLLNKTQHWFWPLEIR